MPFLCAEVVGKPTTAFDHSLWDAFLKKYVNDRGEVNYQAAAKDPSLLDQYLQLLATCEEDDVKLFWPREEAMAFWLNAYHAGLIKLVIDHYPVQSVQTVPSFWDITIIHLKQNDITKKNEDSDKGQGKDSKKEKQKRKIRTKTKEEARFSLNDIRVTKLLAVYHNEKIDLALSLGARGGPRLRPEAFTGPKVEGQLFLATREFINNPAYVEIIPSRKKIKISKLFKWYVNDFTLDFGKPESFGKFTRNETTILAFLAYYLENEEQVEYLQEGNYKIEYPVFDWALNDWKEAVSPNPQAGK